MTWPDWSRMTTLPPTMGPSPTLPVMVASIPTPLLLVGPPLPPPLPPPPQPDSDRSKNSAEGQSAYLFAIRKAVLPWRSVQEVRSCLEPRLPEARRRILLISYPQLYPCFVSAGWKAGRHHRGGQRVQYPLSCLRRRRPPQIHYTRNHFNVCYYLLCGPLADLPTRSTGD